MAYEASLKHKRDVASVNNSARRAGVLEGMDKKGVDVVRNLIEKFGFDDEQAANAAEVSLDFVQKVRASLNKKK